VGRKGGGSGWKSQQQKVGMIIRKERLGQRYIKPRGSPKESAIKENIEFGLRKSGGNGNHKSEQKCICPGGSAFTLGLASREGLKGGESHKHGHEKG